MKDYEKNWFKFKMGALTVLLLTLISIPIIHVNLIVSENFRELMSYDIRYNEDYNLFWKFAYPHITIVFMSVILGILIWIWLGDMIYGYLTGGLK